MSAPVTLTPKIQVEGQDLPAAQLQDLVGLRIERGLGIVGRATLRLVDVGFLLSAGGSYKPGTKVRISSADNVLLMAGEVTGLSVEQDLHAPPELVVTVDEVSYKLGRGDQAATYVQMTYSDVVRKIVSRYGLELEMSASTTVYDYLVQNGSDLAYLDAIVRRLGWVWWTDDRTVHVTSPSAITTQVSAALGLELRNLSVRTSALHPTKVTVSGWNPDNQTALTGQSDPVDTSGLSSFAQPFVAASGLSDAGVVTEGWPATSQAEATDLAKATLGDWAASSMIARGSAMIMPALGPGVALKVSDAGPLNGTYRVTEVEHSYTARGFFTSFVCGPQRPVGLVDVLGDQRGDTSGFLNHGMVVGVVTNSDNTDAPEGGYCRVKYVGAGGEVESAWARMVSVGSGKNRGITFVPEVNDEVLIGFDRGDTRRPVIIGSLYSKQNTLPAGQIDSGAVNFRRITSRLGHVIELGDGSADTSSHVALRLATEGYLLRLGADKFEIEVPAGKPLSIKSGSSSFAIADSGDLTISAPNVTIKADNSLTLQGQSAASLKGAQVAVQGEATVSIKANGTAQVEASGPVSVKGAIVQLN